MSTYSGNATQNVKEVNKIEIVNLKIFEKEGIYILSKCLQLWSIKIITDCKVMDKEGKEDCHRSGPMKIILIEAIIAGFWHDYHRKLSNQIWNIIIPFIWSSIWRR